nr:voltage dependent calcium channel subunit [Hymenolepis microstoma]
MNQCSHKTIVESFQDLIYRGKITITKLDPLVNVKDYASKLYKLFLRKAEALDKVVQDVEEEATKYPWNPLLKNISFVALTDKGENLERHHYFNIPVNRSESGVYIPSEVYINDTVILHQVDWTSNLDHIFQKQNDTLNFIYFASEYGFLRTYPRYQWPMDDSIKALDARRKSWYTQYTGVPKDVLFLVDTSGSMHGQALNLANTSLRLLIETLNKNDFFAVAKFPTSRDNLEPSYIYGCFYNGSCYNSLVQATSLNKQQVIRNVFRLTAHDTADYDAAIEFGMKQMSAFSTHRPATAHCNKIMVLISDSDIDYSNRTTQDMLTRYKDYVHLITYSLSTITGPGPLDKFSDRINGAFAQIPVTGALSTILRHFTETATGYGTKKKRHLLGLDLVVHQAADIFPFKIAEEIGPMASLTMAVYNRSLDRRVSLLGIMGTDVSAREMVDLLQPYLNSPTDYAFMIDNNGFVLFHPLLKSYRKLSAQTIDIDIMDIEVSGEKELLTIRKNLIDNREGVTVLDDFAVFMDENHAHRTLRTYAYTPIPETEYSICLVTATERDTDVQFLSQKELLRTTDNALYIKGVEMTTLPLPVKVVLAPILANCRKPSFSRILAPPTTTTATTPTTTTTTSTTTTTTPAPTTTEPTTLDPDILNDLFRIWETTKAPKEDEDEAMVEVVEGKNKSEQNENIRKKRSDFHKDSAGMKEIEKVLRFIDEYDFGNTFYDGHFMSDLLVGLNVLRDWKSTRMSNYVTARSVFFTSGLGFIYPPDVEQKFEPLLTADFANSSIWQRVLDSHGLIFWIQPQLSKPIIPLYEEVPVFTFPTTESTDSTEETEQMDSPTDPTVPEDYWSGLPPIPGFEVTKTDTSTTETTEVMTSTTATTTTPANQSTESMSEETGNIAFPPIEVSEQTTPLESTTLSTLSTVNEPSSTESTASRVKRDVSNQSYSTPPTSESSYGSAFSSGFTSPSLTSFKYSTNMSTLSSAEFTISHSSTDSTDAENLSEETNSTLIGSSYSLFTSEISTEEISTEGATTTTTPEPEIIVLPKVSVFLDAQASQNGLTNTFAVAGLTLSETYLQKMLQRFENCDDEDTCYFLDDAAFVMAVNREKMNYQVGYFLGYVDPPLMESLLDNNVYSRVKHYDYQAICDFAHLGEKNCTSPAIRLIPNIVRSLAQIFNPHFWLSLINQLVSVFTKLANVLFVFSQMFIKAFAVDQKIDYVNCVKLTYRYYPTDGANFGKKPINITEINGTFTCSPECTRKWSAISVPDTNLKLIRTDKICACIQKDYDWRLTPTIADDISICQSAPNPRYRRPVHACDI